MSLAHGDALLILGCSEDFETSGSYIALKISVAVSAGREIHARLKAQGRFESTALKRLSPTCGPGAVAHV